MPQTIIRRLVLDCASVSDALVMLSLPLDEATSALDVSVQAQILALLNEIRENLG